MTTTITKEAETTAVIAQSAKQKANRKPSVPAQAAHVASTKTKPGKKTTPAKKALKSAKKPEKTATTREGSKTAQILELLKRPGGASMQEIMKATEWQPHSVRGFISGTLGKKMKLSVASTKGDDGQRTYSLKA